MSKIEGWESTEKAAKLTGYNADYVRQLCREGKVTAVRVGNAYLVEMASLWDYMAGGEKRGPQEK